MEYISIPTNCPVCGAELIIDQKYKTKVLKCINKNCDAQQSSRLLKFISVLGIETLSIGTVTKLIDFGWLNTFEDVFLLKNHKEEWLQKDGFGARSVNVILDQIEKARTTELWKVLTAIGIPNVERQTAKLLAEECKTYDNFRQMKDFTSIKGIGKVVNDNIINFDYTEADKVMSYLIIIGAEEKQQTMRLENKSFCITGKLNHFSNRNELVKLIEENGGKFTGVNAKTDYLISNDKNSNTGKTKKAKDLNVPIISEEEFLNLLESE